MSPHVRLIAIIPILTILFDTLPAPARADVCTGHFVNPITDVCWDCLFPLTLGSVPLFTGGEPDAPNPASPICLCPAPPPLFFRPGLEVGFWEPVRLEDVTARPFCFPNLGGIDIPVGIGAPTQARAITSEADNNTGYHVHWYIYPVMYWLELLTDFLCLEEASFDIGYITELDPTWNDDQLSEIEFPDTYLFDNPIATAACAVDCVGASLTGQANPDLFWCAGCQGTMYPVEGHIVGENSQVNGSLLAGERLAFKLHRLLLADGTMGDAAVCQKYPMPIMDKRQYRFQMVNPTSVPAPIANLTCPAIGVGSILWETARVVPAVGEDLGFLIWRKRNCCSF